MLDREHLGTEPRAATAECSDGALVAGICRGDHKALETLYGRYFNRLFRFVYRIVRRVEPVEEVINDVMYVVWQRAATYDQSSKVSTWIFGIAFNKALKALQPPPGGQTVSWDEHTGVMPDATDRIELEDWLTVALNELSPEHRAVIELTYYQGMSYAEIADVMGCPENTVKTRMFHARAKLKTILPALVDGATQPSA